ncbi:hypothetical protein WJX74_010630 [Apatococcus lobatus]|uniref:Dynamin-type G domain-containing protein n=1 Tax=Apatococcus lobatus TaxID=904363 RepID=A0AAW1RJV8_9CHLO
MNQLYTSSDEVRHLRFQLQKAQHEVDGLRELQDRAEGSAGRRETVRDLKQQEAELRRLLEDERKRCAVAEADRDEALDRADRLEERVQEQEDMLLVWEERHASVTEKLKDAEEEVISMRLEREEFLRSTDFLDGTSADLKGTIRQQDWKIDRLTKENRALEARLLDQRNQIQAVQAENLEVSEKIVKLDADLQSQLAKSDQKEQHIAAAAREANALQLQLAALTKESDSLQAQLQELEPYPSECDRLHKQLQHMQSLLDQQAAASANLHRPDSPAKRQAGSPRLAFAAADKGSTLSPSGSRQGPHMPAASAATSRTLPISPSGPRQGLHMQASLNSSRPGSAQDPHLLHADTPTKHAGSASSLAAQTAEVEVARLRHALRQATDREAELLETCEVLQRDLSSAREHVSSRIAAQHEQLLQRLSAQDAELCRLQARVRQADQAYDQVERDRHFLQKQTASHAGPDAELRAAQDHIRQLQRQLQLLERKCAGQVAQINALTLQVQALLDSGGQPQALQRLPTSGLSRLQSFPMLMLDQKPYKTDDPLQLEAHASLQGFLTEPGRQSSDCVLQITEAADTQAGESERLPLSTGDAHEREVVPDAQDGAEAVGDTSILGSMIGSARPTRDQPEEQIVSTLHPVPKARRTASSQEAAADADASLSFWEAADQLAQMDRRQASLSVQKTMPSAVEEDDTTSVRIKDELHSALAENIMLTQQLRLRTAELDSLKERMPALRFQTQQDSETAGQLLRELSSVASLPKAKPSSGAHSQLVQSGSRRMSSKRFRTLETQTFMAEPQDMEAEKKVPRRSGSLKPAPDDFNLGRNQSSKQYRTLDTQASMAEQQDKQPGEQLPHRSASMMLVPDDSNLSQLPSRVTSDAESVDIDHSNMHTSQTEPFEVTSPGPEQDTKLAMALPKNSVLSRTVSSQLQRASSRADQPSDMPDDDAAASSNGGSESVPEVLQQQLAHSLEDQHQEGSASSSQATDIVADEAAALDQDHGSSQSELPANSLPAAEVLQDSSVQQNKAADDQDGGRQMALEAQMSSLREQLHATYRMAKAMREERDDAQMAIDQMVADHHEVQLESERRLAELHASAQDVGSEEVAGLKMELAQKDETIASLEQRLTELRKQALQQSQQDQQKIEQLLRDLHDKEHGALQELKEAVAKIPLTAADSSEPVGDMDAVMEIAELKGSLLQHQAALSRLQDDHQHLQAQHSVVTAELHRFKAERSASDADESIAQPLPTQTSLNPSRAEQKCTTLQLAMKDQKLAQMRNVVRELEGKLADALKRGTDVVMRESSWREQEALETKLRQTERERSSLIASQSSLRMSLQHQQSQLEQTEAQREKESDQMNTLEKLLENEQTSAKTLEHQLTKERQALQQVRDAADGKVDPSQLQEALVKATSMQEVHDLQRQVTDLQAENKHLQSVVSLPAVERRGSLSPSKLGGRAMSILSRGFSTASGLAASPSPGGDFYRTRAQTQDNPGSQPLQPVDENQGMTRHGSLLSKEAALEQWEDRKKLQKRADSLKAKLRERAAEVEQVTKERDRYADQMRRLQADAAQQSKTVQQLEMQVRQASAMPTAKVKELVEKIEQLEEARGQLQRKMSLQALPKPAAKPAAASVITSSDLKSSMMRKEAEALELRLERDQATAQAGRLSTYLQELFDADPSQISASYGKRGSKTAALGEPVKEKQLMSTISGLQAALDKAQNDQQAGVSNAKYMQVVDKRKALAKRVQELECKLAEADAARNQAQQLERQCSQLQAAHSSLKRQLSTSQVQAERSQAASEQAVQLEQVLDDQGRELEQMQQLVQQQEQQLQAARASNSSKEAAAASASQLRSQLQELQTENEDLRQEFCKLAVAKHRSRLSTDCPMGSRGTSGITRAATATAVADVDWSAPSRSWDNDPDSPTARNSPFGEGSTLLREAQVGPIGKFHRALLSLGPAVDLKDFQLPKLICLGNQSTGKSSLLESITKCPIFPRGDVMTTRAPVCLRMEHVASTANAVTEVSFGDGPAERLQSESDIVAAVRHRMDSIPAGTIVKQPITVRICKPDVPTMEIIDLPGIKSTPPAARAMTEQIVKDYLAEEATLALCVVDATCPELTSSQGIGFVIDQKKEARTIVTLTKSDLLDRTNIERQLVRRVLKKTGEAIDKFAGCVAVINRRHHDQVTLLEAGEEEERTFRSKVFDKIPQNMKQYETALRGNIGIANLIHQVEQLYRDYVKNVWRQRAMNILAYKFAEAQQALDILGIPPGPALSPAQVLNHAAIFMDFAGIAQHLLVDDKRPSLLQISLPRRNGLPQASSGLCHLTNAASWLDLKAYGSLEHADRLLQVTVLVEAAISTWLQRAPYIEFLQAHIRAVFLARSEMHLHRFQQLQDVILNEGLNKLIDTGKIRDELLANLVPQLRLIQLDFHRHISVAASLTRLDEAIRVGIVQRAILPLQRGGLVKCVPAGFQLQESNEYQLKRQKAQENLANVKAAMDVIVNIDKDMDGPAEGSSRTQQQISVSR